MKTLYFIFFFIITAGYLFAQNEYEVSTKSGIYNLLQNDAIGGKISIVQDTSITNLMLKDIEINSKANGIADGYRIQIISVSGRNAREESSLAREKFLNIYPNFDQQQIYTLYEPPLFKVRIGNYRDKFESLKFYKEILKYFPNAYLVKGQIEYPSID